MKYINAISEYQMQTRTTAKGLKWLWCTDTCKCAVLTAAGTGFQVSAGRGVQHYWPSYQRWQTEKTQAHTHTNTHHTQCSTCYFNKFTIITLRWYFSCLSMKRKKPLFQMFGGNSHGKSTLSVNSLRIRTYRTMSSFIEQKLSKKDEMQKECVKKKKVHLVWNI